MIKFITYKFCDLFLDTDVKGNLYRKKIVYSFSPHIVKNYVKNPN